MTAIDTRIPIEEALRQALTDAKTDDPVPVTEHDIKVRLAHARYSLNDKELEALLAAQERTGNIERVDPRTVNARWRLVRTEQSTAAREVVRSPKPNFGPPRRTQPQTDGSSALQPLELTEDEEKNTRRMGTAEFKYVSRIRQLEEKVTQMQQDKQDLTAQLEESKAITPLQQSVMVRPMMTVQDLLDRDRFIRDMIDNFLKPGIDYGPPFPGSRDVSLWKAGAEKFMAAFELRPDYIEIEKVIERDKTPGGFVCGHIRYEYRCNLHVGHLGGPIVGTAIGICSTEEEKYKYRKQERICPECGQATVYRSKRADQDGDKGWYCWTKKDGCGANFKSDDSRIVSQEVGRVENPDMMGLQHTIAAMAQKRAELLALRAAAGLSSYFSEMVADEDSGGKRTTINGTATEKTTASIASELIEYAESLLPEGHGLTRNQIGAACLNALDMKDWSDDYAGSLDDAKQAIAQRINEKFGNGEKAGGYTVQSTETEQTTQDTVASTKNDKTPENAPQSVTEATCVKCEQNPPLNDDGPYPFLCKACAEDAAKTDAAKNS